MTDSKSHFELMPRAADSNSGYYWHRRSNNGEITFHAEVFDDQDAAVKSMRRVVRDILTEAGVSKATFKLLSQIKPIYYYEFFRTGAMSFKLLFETEEDIERCWDDQQELMEEQTATD